MKYQQIPILCDYAKAGIQKKRYQPYLYTYILDNYEEIQPKRKRPAIIICPGGGYSMTSFREGEHIAIRFNALGFQTFILKYSTTPDVFPAAQMELAAAIALVRKNATEWHVNPDKIILAGFSAGGHLAASLGVFWNKKLPANPKNSTQSFSLAPEGCTSRDIKPNGLILSYPVISSGEFAHEDSFKKLLKDRYDELHELMSLEKQVTEKTPPTFIWHTFEDTCVPVENSLLFATALRQKKVPFELHIYQPGEHGLAGANEETINSTGWGIQPECQNWIDMAATWIRNL